MEMHSYFAVNLHNHRHTSTNVPQRTKWLLPPSPLGGNESRKAEPFCGTKQKRPWPWSPGEPGASVGGGDGRQQQCLKQANPWDLGPWEIFMYLPLTRTPLFVKISDKNDAYLKCASFQRQRLPAD